MSASWFFGDALIALWKFKSYCTCTQDKRLWIRIQITGKLHIYGKACSLARPDSVASRPRLHDRIHPPHSRPTHTQQLQYICSFQCKSFSIFISYHKVGLLSFTRNQSSEASKVGLYLQRHFCLAKIGEGAFPVYVANRGTNNPAFADITFVPPLSAIRQSFKTLPCRNNA